MLEVNHHAPAGDSPSKSPSSKNVKSTTNADGNRKQHVKFIHHFSVGGQKGYRSPCKKYTKQSPIEAEGIVCLIVTVGPAFLLLSFSPLSLMSPILKSLKVRLVFGAEFVRQANITRTFRLAFVRLVRAQGYMNFVKANPF